jgi:hypothetical protein
MVKGSFSAFSATNAGKNNLSAAKIFNTDSKYLSLKVEDFGFRGQIDQMGTSVKTHIGKELGLVNLTSLGAGNSDPNGDFLLHQIGEIVIRAITRDGFHTEVSGFVRPCYPTVNKEQVYHVPLGMGNLCKLETPGCRLVVILAQDKKKTDHHRPPSIFS